VKALPASTEGNGRAWVQSGLGQSSRSGIGGSLAEIDRIAAMLGRALALAFFAWAASPAAAQVRCPDGGAPRLTGELFHPLACSEAQLSLAAGVDVSTASLPDADAARGRLEDLDGTWRGFAVFGASRYDLTLTVSRGGTRWVWTTMDQQLHLATELDETVTKGFFAKPPYKLALASPSAPGRKLSGRLWAGAAPLEAGRHPEKDRLLAWRFEGLAAVQKLQYSLAGDRLRALYTLADPARGRRSTELDLQRAAAKR
jgi:hypothetical protein